MEDQKYYELIQALSFFEENSIPTELIIEQLNPNYIDSLGNNYFHYLSNYSFKEFCFYEYNPTNNEIIKIDKYNSLINQYLKKIKSYINTLISINCNISLENYEKHTPLDLCLIKQNYYVANELINYFQNYGPLFDGNKLNILYFNNFIEEECINFLLSLFSNVNPGDDMIRIYLGRPIDNEGANTPLNSIFRDYNQNIYNKFKEFIKINSARYLIKDIDEYSVLSSDEIKNEIVTKSVSDINNFCLTSFYNLYIRFIQFGADINFAEKDENKYISDFMYLMAYPMIPEIHKFITINNININYQDYFGRTPLIHLINNKKNIVNISRAVYYEAFIELINSEAIDLSKRDKNGISAFLLCLINDYYEDAKEIYNKHIDKLLSDFNLDFLLIFIIKMNTNKFNEDFLIKINKIFGNEINYNFIDDINERTFLHYFFMYYSNNFDIYIKTLNFIINLIAYQNKKDIFNRNCLFYLFIDFSGDSKKVEDPYKILEFCLENKLFQISINEKDIFGNSLINYSLKGGFKESMNILLKYGAILDYSINDEGNNIFSISLMANDDIFLHLYNMNKIPNILEQKVFVMCQNFNFFLNSMKEKIVEVDDNENKNNLKLSMYDFFHNPELILDASYSIEQKKINKHVKEIDFEKIENYLIPSNNESHFSLLNLLDEKQKKAINNYYNENFNYKFENPLKKASTKIDNKNILNIIEILKYPKKYIELVKSKIKCIFSGNIEQYLINNKKVEILMKLNENSKINEISKCKIYLELNDTRNLVINLEKIINKNNEDTLKALRNDDGQNIFHILGMIVQVEGNEIDAIYDKLNKYKIDNLYDSFGNTPMYYACNKLNKKFIEKFSNYFFGEKINSNINFSLFLETKNDKIPLTELYKKLNLEDNDLLSLIIELAVKEKIGDITYIIYYLITKYNSSQKNYFIDSYNNNLSNSKYIIKIIGLYQYLVNALCYSIMFEDEKGNSPFMLCIINNNYDFLFDVLLPETRKNSINKFDSKNKEGKTIIHLILQSKVFNKKEILIQLLNEGFNYNVKDNKQLLPIDYALINKDNEIYEILKLQYEKDGLLLEKKLLYNFYEDSDILFNESIIDSSKYQQCEDLFDLVCKDFKYYGDKIHKVCMDSEYIPYNIQLIRGNVLFKNILVTFNMQILENTNKQNFILVLKDTNFNNEIEFDNLKDAEDKFKEIFKLKTNNNWDEVKKDKTKFKTNLLRYYSFSYDYIKENDIFDYLKIAINNLFIKKNLKFNGNYKIRDLIYHLSIKAYNNRFTSNVEENSRCIIKNYKTKAINDAFIILTKIGNLIQDGKNKTNLEKKKLNYLIKSYLELIPFSIYKNNKNILQSGNEVNEEKGRITTFYFIENILKIFLGAIKNLDNLHPLDYIINSLGCNIIELDDENIEKIYIEKFLKNSGANNIKNIYKITESKNDVNFNPNNFERRIILCHGTKSENILGILSEGLKISPAQAKFQGQQFGEGIYLSDSFDVSFKYSKNYFSNEDTTFLLLIEAAIKNKEDHSMHFCNLNDYKFVDTQDGYKIIDLDERVYSKGIIVINDSMNVRVKYIVEI